MLNRTLALAAALLHVPLAHAQTTWRVVAGEDGRVINNGMPDGTGRGLVEGLLGDVGAGLIGVRVTSPGNLAGYWSNQSGTFVRYTELGVATTRGPGRAGAEADHVFLNVYSDGGGAAPDGQRLFAGRAGPAGNTALATYGLWRWDKTRNVEIARSLTDGPFGPGLGAGWNFPNSSTFATARQIANGAAVLDADITSPTGASGHAIVKHVPGSGNQPCIRAGATEAALAPGLIAGDAFGTSWTMNSLSMTSSGRVYGRLSTTNSRHGIWEICSGAPRALAVDSEIGARGPDLGIATATFTNDFMPAYPGIPGQFHFFNYFRRTSGATSEYGLFRNDGTSNKPVAYRDASGYYGPNWLDATWNTFYQDTLSVGGAYATFSARVTTSDGGNPVGLWRARNGQRPELVALIGIPGAYGPELNRTWRSFGATAVLANGDILLEARTDPGDTYALWLLEPGRAPRRLLAPGDTIAIPTTTGTVQSTINSFDISGDGADYSRGRDSWIGADGSVLVVAFAATYGEIVLTTQAADRIFRSSME